MTKLFEIIGNGAGLLGVLICLVAGVGRILGSYHVMGFESITLFTGGIALMVTACLVKLHQLTSR